jgi:hypothetical protein
MQASENGSSGPGYHLLMDYFNNDWLVPTPEDLDQKLSVPKLVAEPRKQNGPRRPIHDENYTYNTDRYSYQNEDSYYDVDSESDDKQ